MGYVKNGLPSSDATVTDISGVGGVFNIPAGETTVYAERAEDGAPIFEFETLVRAGHITVFTRRPNR